MRAAFNTTAGLQRGLTLALSIVNVGYIQPGFKTLNFLFVEGIAQRVVHLNEPLATLAEGKGKVGMQQVRSMLGWVFYSAVLIMVWCFFLA